jgi:hypothetical protein
MYLALVSRTIPLALHLRLKKSQGRTQISLLRSMQIPQRLVLKIGSPLVAPEVGQQALKVRT